MVWIQLVQNTDQRWTPANTATKFLCPQNAGKFLTNSATIRFSRKSLSMELLSDCILKHETAKLLRNFFGCSGVKLNNRFIYSNQRQNNVIPSYIFISSFVQGHVVSRPLITTVTYHKLLSFKDSR